MEWVETTGRTVSEAKDLALDQLGVDEADAEFEILDEPRPGLFGRMRGEARVRARVRPTRPRPKVERRDRRRKRDGSSETEPTTARSDAAEPAEGSPASSTPPRRRRSTGSSRSSATSATRTSDSPDRPDSTPPTDQQEVTAMDTSPPPTDADQVTTADDAAVSAAAVGAEAVRFLEGLVDAFGLEGSVELVQAGDDLEVSLSGDDLGVMIGPRGTTLLAVQDLTRVVAQRRLGDHETRLRVDIGGYRERRRAALGRFATMMADEVVGSGTARVLEPMPSADRKVVHDVLAERDDVVTRSEGEDPFRRVVISPA